MCLSRLNRRSNSSQSPLLLDLHQAARRLAARSASRFSPGSDSNSSDSSSSMVAALAASASGETATASSFMEVYLPHVRRPASNGAFDKRSFGACVRQRGLPRGRLELLVGNDKVVGQAQLPAGQDCGGHLVSFSGSGSAIAVRKRYGQSPLSSGIVPEATVGSTVQRGPGRCGGMTWPAQAPGRRPARPHCRAANNPETPRPRANTARLSGPSA